MSTAIPLCAGKWALFDSTNVADHRIAAQLCADCPMRLGCEGELRRAQQQKPMPGAAYGPQGTWAGMLLNPRMGKS